MVPQIKFKMALDFNVKAVLKKFWILKSPSVAKSLCDDDQDKKTVATLIIQLPCKYEGGQHEIKPKSNLHHLHSSYVNLSVKSDARSEFSPFCMVFHRDYNHEMIPITNGIGAYLIYDLTVCDANYIPKTPSKDDVENELVLMNLLQQWKDPGKLVIGVSNEYTKENLSFENLKGADLTIAMQLKKFSTNCFYEIFVGFLNRTFHGEVPDADTKFDTKYASNIFQTDYNIECLKHVDGKEFVDFTRFKVNFDDEVWPVDCFRGVKSYRCSREHFRDLEGSGVFMEVWDQDDLGFHVAKYYRRPVIVLVKSLNLIDELKKACVTVTDIYRMFIALHHQYKPHSGNQVIRNLQTEKMLGNWASTISHMHLSECNKKTKTSKESAINFLKALVSLGDIQTIKNYFENNRSMTKEIVLLLISQCNKYGWLQFSQQLCTMFKETATFSRAQKYFQLFLDSADLIEPNQRIVLQSVFEIILNNEKNRIHTIDSKEFFHSIWLLAKKIDFDLREFGKSQNINDMVPFLIQLAEGDAQNKCDDNWIDIANHFLYQMERRFTNKPQSNWRQKYVGISGNCDCLKNLLTFLNDDLESITFNLYKMHRTHFEKAISRIPNIICTNSKDSGMADIVLTKTNKTGQDELKAYDHNLSMLMKLRSICQSR